MPRNFLILFFLYLTFANAHVAPELRWKTLFTQHFEVIFETHQQILAEEFVRSAERAHALLSPIFEAPNGRTILWLTDHTDAPNGMATVFPRNTIILYPVLPGALDSISHYDSWSQKLVTHEYAHILNMEPAKGFWGPVRFIYGNIVRPNALLPTWYLEGLAVEAESQFTQYGRLRSPYFNALIRAMVMDGTWNSEPLSYANETMIPKWPYGLRPYFWGSLIMHEISQRKGFKSLGELNERYAARVPFFVHGPIRDLLGVNYEEFFREIHTSYEKLALEQLAALKSTLKVERVKNQAGEIHSPALSRDSLKLAFVSINDDRDSEIYVVERAIVTDDFDFSKATVVFAGSLINRVAFWPDGQSIVFDAVNKDHLYDSFSDIHRLHLSDKRKENLTKLGRAKEPEIDHEGHRIVFVKTGGAKTELGVLTRGNVVNLVYAPPLLYRISRPSFLNEEEIIFSERSPDGKEILKVFNLQTKGTRVLFADFEPAQLPVVTSRGLLFASSRSGVSNLYFSEQMGAPRAVTQSPTAITAGVLDETHQQLLYSQLTGEGFRLHKQELPKEAVRVATVSSLIKKPEYVWSEPQVTGSITTEEYSPMSYLLPQYWIPLFGFVENGWAVSALTSAGDPLRKHAYAIAGNYDSLSSRVGVDGRYDLAAGDGTLSALGGIDHRYYYAFNLTATNTNAELRYSFFPTRESKNWNLGVRSSRETTEIPGARIFEYAGPAVFASYSDASQKPTEISPTSGISAMADYQYYLGPWGNTEFSKTRLAFSGYTNYLIPKRHALALDLNAYLSPRNRSVYLGTSAGGDYSLTFLSAKSLLLRGYPVGEFLGWNMIAGSLEYRFPFSDKPMDWSTFPTMLRRWHAAVFFDALTSEGFYYAKDTGGARSSHLGSFFYGTGVEVRSDITLAYHMPAMLRIGLYAGLNGNAYGGVGPFVSLSIPQF